MDWYLGCKNCCVAAQALGNPGECRELWPSCFPVTMGDWSSLLVHQISFATPSTYFCHLTSKSNKKPTKIKAGVCQWKNTVFRMYME